MMTNNFRDRLLDRLADDLSNYPMPIYSFGELPDKWLAKSLLQKAIRRNDLQSAMHAASFLIAEDGNSFWRRLPIIGWEEIGLVDLTLCASIDLMAGSKRLRARLGSDKVIGSHLVTRMCAAVKDRSSDDLLTVLEHDIEISQQKYLFVGNWLPNELIEATIKPATSLYSHFSRSRMIDADVQAFLGFVLDNHPEIAGILFAGYKRTSSILPLLSAMMFGEWNKRPYNTAVRSDDFGFTYKIDRVARYAYDGNTRAGRKYLDWLSSTDDGLADYLGHIRSKNTQRKLIRKLYFRSKSSLVANRVDWKVGNRLRERADQVGYGLSVNQIEEGKKLLAIAMLRYPMSDEHL